MSQRNGKRKSPTLSEKLASALLELQRLRGDPIDRDHAKAMSAEMICSLFQFDHDAGYACHGHGNHPTGLTPLLRPAHREKTKTDIGAIAKVRRLSASQEAHRAAILGKGDVAPVEGRKRARFQSAGFDKTMTKKFDGTVVRRER